MRELMNGSDRADATIAKHRKRSRMMAASSGVSRKNVMISRRGYCKVIDVGLAKRVSESEHTYTSCGTPLYLAPEIIHKTGCT